VQPNFRVHRQLNFSLVVGLYPGQQGKLLDLTCKEVNAQKIGATVVGANNDDSKKKGKEERKRNQHPTHM